MDETVWAESGLDMTDWMSRALWMMALHHQFFSHIDEKTAAIEMKLLLDLRKVQKELAYSNPSDDSENALITVTSEDFKKKFIEVHSYDLDVTVFNHLMSYLLKEIR